LDDLNESFLRLKKAGVGTGGLWEVWDTKSERAGTYQDEVKKLAHLRKPFNNTQTKTTAGYLAYSLDFFSLQELCKQFQELALSGMEQCWSEPDKEAKSEVSQKCHTSPWW